MPYPETYATMIDLISQKLQDTGNATWADAELLLYITEGLREISQYSPHIYMVEYTIESRRGTATSGTTTNTLEDATLDQFLAGDVGKIVFNTTDRTWAYITAYTDAENVTLSNDIMVSGEGYRIFNKNCNHQKEIYIGEMPDWLWIDKIEFPAMNDPPTEVKWIDRGKNVIRLDIDDEPDDTKNADAKKQVWIFFAMRHKLSQLLKTDYLVDLTAGYAAGATTIHIDAATTTETIEMGQEFTIANERSRAIYICTENETMVANEGDMKIWPPLESSVADGVAITFIGSTLTPKLEGIFADLVAGKAAMNKANSFVDTVNIGGANTSRLMYERGKLMYDAAIRELEGLRGYTAPSVCLP